MPNPTFSYGGYVYGEQNSAIFMLYNGDPTGQKIIKVLNCRTRPTTAPTQTTAGQANADTNRLARITGDPSGGITIPAVAADTSNTLLTTDVAILAYAGVTLTSATDYLRTQLLYPLIVTTNCPTLIGPGFFAPGQVENNEFFSTTKKISDIQSITLQKGEGIAIVANDQTKGSFNASFYIGVTLICDGKTFFAQGCVSAIPGGLAMFSVSHLTASALSTCIVTEINIFPAGLPTIATTFTDAPTLRFLRTVGYSGGATVSPVSLGGEPLPSTVSLVVGQSWAPITVDLYGFDKAGLSVYDLLYPSANQAFVRRAGVFRQLLTNMNNVKNVPSTIGIDQDPSPVNGGLSFWSGQTSVSPPILQSGEGFGIMLNNVEMWATFFVEILFTVEPAGSQAYRMNS